MSDKIYRILDANLNRYKEGIRVVEDFARYYLDNSLLSKELKNLRHLAKLDATSEFLKFRDSQNDVLKQNTPQEMVRLSPKDIIFANLKRAQESSRVLEECFKLINLEYSAKFKLARYELYEIEKKFNQLL